MSAVSNLTYVTLHDETPGTSQFGSGTVVFSNYNEAMSYGKWASLKYGSSAENVIYIWNYNGGSGKWYVGGWTDIPNTNWP